MIYLTGVTNEETRALAKTTPQLGLILQPGNRSQAQIMAYSSWAADTGCYTEASFDIDAWITWLDALPRHRALFATAPDVVGDHVATLARSSGWLRRIRNMGFPSAFVLQDGATVATIPWDDFDVAFVGGTTAFKLAETTYELVAEARRRRKWTHMGRVNSWRRLRAAAHGGYQSADGTVLAFAPDANLPRIRTWLAALDRQPFLA